jgi:hypothetical protein
VLASGPFILGPGVELFEHVIDAVELWHCAMAVTERVPSARIPDTERCKRIAGESFDRSEPWIAARAPLAAPKDDKTLWKHIIVELH